jgi:hypothetical protein
VVPAAQPPSSVARLLLVLGFLVVDVDFEGLGLEACVGGLGKDVIFGDEATLRGGVGWMSCSSARVWGGGVAVVVGFDDRAWYSNAKG